MLHHAEQYAAIIPTLLRHHIFQSPLELTNAVLLGEVLIRTPGAGDRDTPSQANRGPCRQAESVREREHIAQSIAVGLLAYEMAKMLDALA